MRAMRYDTIRYNTIVFACIGIFNSLFTFTRDNYCQAFEHSQSKSIFFSFLDIVAIRIFDSAATNVFNVHFVNRCECDVRSYILYVCFNSLIHLYFTAFNSCVCSCIYVNKKKEEKKEKKKNNFGGQSFRRPGELL